AAFWRTLARRALQVARIQPRAERPAGAGQHDADDLLIGCGALHGRSNLLDHPEGKGVELFGPVEPDDGDGGVDFRDHIRHLTAPLRWRFVQLAAKCPPLRKRKRRGPAAPFLLASVVELIASYLVCTAEMIDPSGPVSKT